MNAQCKCDFCKLCDEVRNVLTVRHEESMAAMIDKLMNLYVNTAEELDWHRCVLNGSWPSAVEVLEMKLAKAKAMPGAAER